MGDLLLALNLINKWRYMICLFMPYKYISYLNMTSIGLHE